MAFNELRRQMVEEKRRNKEAERQRREEERDRKQREKDYYKASRKALKDSVVPGLARKLQRFSYKKNGIKRQYWERAKVNKNGSMSVYVSSGYVTFETGSSSYTDTLGIDGRPDGTIRIGERTLSTAQAKDKALVERVLTEEYRKK